MLSAWNTAFLLLVTGHTAVQAIHTSLHHQTADDPLAPPPQVAMLMDEMKEKLKIAMANRFLGKDVTRFSASDFRDGGRIFDFVKGHRCTIVTAKQCNHCLQALVVPNKYGAHCHVATIPQMKAGDANVMNSFANEHLKQDRFRFPAVFIGRKGNELSTKFRGGKKALLALERDNKILPVLAQAGFEKLSDGTGEVFEFEVSASVDAADQAKTDEIALDAVNTMREVAGKGGTVIDEMRAANDALEKSAPEVPSQEKSKEAVDAAEADAKETETAKPAGVSS